MKTLPLPLRPRSERSSVSRRQRRSSEGFTLVEVTLAIGIISFAFVAMFGLLPVGLNVSRQAMDTTIEAQIVQQMKTQALQTDFTQLDKLGKDESGNMVPLYFDDQGKQLASDDAVEQERTIYKAVYLPVPATTELPANVSTSRLRTVTISLLNTKGSAQRRALDMATAAEAKKFTILIPDNGL